MGVRQFRSDESGAPELVQAPGSVVNLLKKVLVDGYGSTDPHGSWEYIEDSVAEKAAFRSTDANASGIWLYIDDTGTDNARAAVVGMAEVFTGFDGNDDPNGDTAWALEPDYSNDQWVANAYNTPDPVGWIIVCDERFFYLWNAMVFDAQAVTDLGWLGYWYGGDQSTFWDPATDSTNLVYQYHNPCWVFGDLPDAHPSDSFATLLSAHGVAASSPTLQGTAGRLGVGGSAVGRWFARGADQISKGASAWSVELPFGSTFWCHYINSPAYPDPLSGGATVGGRVGFSDDENSSGSAAYRGALPGIMPFYVDCRNNPGAFASDWPVYSEVSGSALDGTPAEGRTVLVVGFPIGTSNTLYASPGLLDITGPWRPA